MVVAGKMKSNSQTTPSFNPVALEMGEPTLAWTTRGTAAYQRISLALFLAGFATFSLLYCVQPLLPAFSSEFGIGAAQSSLALSVSTGWLAISILCAGALSERVGRRGLMFVSMTLAAAFNLAAAVAPSWHAILLARALEGFSLGGVPAVAMAYLAEEIDPKGLGFSMGLYVGGTAFGGMVGRVGMSIIAEYFSWRVAMMMIGIIDIAAAIAFVLLLPPSKNFLRSATFNSRQHLKSWGLHLSHSRLPIVFAIGCLVMGIFVTIYNYASFRLIAPPFNLSTTETGLIFSAYVFGIVASSWAGSLADRLGRGPVLVSGSIIIAAGLVLTLSHSLVAVITGIVVMTIGFFTAHSVASGWVGRMAQGAKGHAASLYLLAYYLGSSVLGSAGGWFWQKDGWTSVIEFTGVLVAMSLGLSLLLWRKPVR
jgi:YNFM family putative membrane transporter